MMDQTWGLLAVTETAVDSSDGIDWFIVVTGLFGGLAVFLFGMDRMTEALRVAVSSRIRFALARMTKNRFLGAGSGAGITAVIQSSSVTTVLVVGFISSGVMNLSQAIPVILGANIGTTITAQVVAFSVSRYALLIVAIGYALAFFAKSDKRTVQGNLIMGLGLIFFGMSVMGAAMDPLRSYEPFIDLMAAMKNPLLALLVGLVFTALVQSSSATTGIVIVLASEGLITPEAGIALILGANVGTSVTAQLAALGKPPEAVRAAVVHTVFNLVGALAWLPFVGVLVGMVDSIGGPLARQIANAHTIFNVVNTLVFLAFVAQLERLVVRIVPDRPEAEPLRLKYLDDSLLKTPTIALERARLELLRMTSRVQTMLGDVLPALLDGPAEALNQVEALDDEVDDLHGQIIVYLGRVGQRSLSSGSTNELIRLMEATNNLEAIGDLIETNLITLGRHRLANDYRVSDSSRQMIEDYHRQVSLALDLAVAALVQADEEEARAVSRMKKKMKAKGHAIAQHNLSRLTADEEHRVELYRFETDVVANLQRIFEFARRTARLAIPTEEQASS
ncbi:MAG: Na/Pi cotransporter family protein [Acidimicrobiales bacterium]|nr:Na/Pi cotransporter family protein [Acidimicrobiales bacterium]RZV43631.1 MAG: Na/Pi cotransporter family protein [Acidimicrobiales bacterium]